MRYAEGILSKVRVDISTRSVRSVRINQTLAQRLLDTGDVLIFTAGDAPEIVARGIAHPHRVRTMLSPAG